MAMATFISVRHFTLVLLSATFQCPSGVVCLLYRGPYFTLEPPTLVEFTNSTGAEIRCQSDGSPKPSTRWETVSGTRVSQDGTLTIRPFAAEAYKQDLHATFYRCVATNIVGSISSRLVHVLGVLDERIQAQAQDDVVVRGSSAVLRCRVRRSQAPYSAFDAWLRDDGYSITRPTYKEERYSVLHSGELIVHRTNMADTERTYRCRIRNTVSGDTVLSSNTGRAIVIDVGEAVPPKIKLVRGTARATVGRSVDLPCVVTAFPPANVTWYRRQSRKLEPVLETGVMKQVNGILTFEEVKLQHEGSYICVAANELGEVRAETRFTVSEPLGLALMPNYQVVELGMPAKLNCTATTSGTTHLTGLTWFKDGEMLQTSSRVRLETNAQLIIKPVKKEDAGMYQCFLGENLDVAQASAEIAVAETPPSLTQTFYQKAVKPGGSVSLQCQSKGRPLPTFSWERDQEPLFSDHRVRITNVNVGSQVISVLNLTRVTSEDSGLYGCRAVNDAGSVSHVARVSVHGKIFVRQAVSNLTSVPGQDVLLRCRYGGFPVESVTWYRDDLALPRHGRQSLDNDGNLRIRDFQGAVDAGDYVCSVKNMDEEVRATTQLVLVVPPVIDDHFFPETITVDEGSRSRLLCSVSKGDGPLRFQWFKDGRQLSSIPDGSVQYSDDSAMIKFRKVRFRDHGKYTCYATNDAAGDNRTTDVVVNVSPRIKVSPHNTSTILGGRVLLDCTAEGFPTPVVTWQKLAGGDAGSGFEDLRLNFRSYVLPNGSLLIGDVEEFDEGLFRCLAHNGIGSPVNREASLQVQEPPQFKERFKVLYVRRGETFQAKCSASAGDSPVDFTWEKNYRALNCSRCVSRMESDGSDLTILGTVRGDCGVYSCTARNDIGKDVTFLQIVVQEPPDAPWSLSLTNYSSRTASLHWHAPYDGNSEILKYKVQYKLENDLLSGFGYEMAVPAGETTAVLSKLHPVSTYEVRVVAENAFGTSAPSNVTVVTTKEEAPSGPPTSVSLYTTGSQSLKVTWRPPSRDQHHGTILGYHVGYRVAGDDDSSSGTPSVKQVDSRGANSSHGLETTYLTNLRRLTKYAVTVQAYNSAGRGPSSDEVYATTLETAPPTSPSVQVEAHSTTSILVQWKKDPKDRSENTEYVLHYGGDDGDWKTHQLASHERQFLLQNLRCGSQYRLYVTASNSLGMGEPGEEALIRTQGSPPVAPSKDGFVVANKTSALLRLGRWGDGGCPIGRFVLQYRQKLEPPWAAAVQTVSPPPMGEHLLSALAPGKVYELSVVAHNDAGATRAEYDFVTLSPRATKTTTEPMFGRSGTGFRFPLQEHLVFIVPALLSAFVVILVLVILFFYWRRQAPAVADTASEKELPGRKVYAEESFIISELPLKGERGCSQDTQVIGGSIFDSRSKRNYHIYTTNQSVL